MTEFKINELTDTDRAILAGSALTDGEVYVLSSMLFPFNVPPSYIERVANGDWAPEDTRRMFREMGWGCAEEEARVTRERAAQLLLVYAVVAKALANDLATAYIEDARTRFPIRTARDCISAAKGELDTEKEA